MQIKAHSTNYFNSFILVSPDSSALAGRIPGKEGSVALRQYSMIVGAPYMHTSDEVIFAVYADRKDIAPEEREAGRGIFFSKGHPCFRASGLVKSHGWGVHSDHKGRVALFGVETDQYQELVSDNAIKKILGMRSKRV